MKDILTGIGITCVSFGLFVAAGMYFRILPVKSYEAAVANEQQMILSVQDRPQRIGEATIRILKHKGSGKSFHLVISDKGDVFLTPFDATAPSVLFPD